MAIDAMNIQLGTLNGRSILVDIAVRDTAKGPELSISGQVGRGRNCIAFGQITDELEELIGNREYTPGADILLGVWRQWHLNGMRAGCEHQRHLIPPEDRIGAVCPVCGYRYGSAWLYEPLPAEVITFLETFISSVKRSE